jgi:hypothetical protein
MDTTASRIIMAQKIPYILFWREFRKNSLLFQNGVVMGAPAQRIEAMVIGRC